MTDRVHPSAKPAAATTATTNGAAAAAAATNGTPTTARPAANGTPTKPQLYRPYRPQPRKLRRRRRCSLCCCCFWTILLLLFVALLAAITGAALYVLYHPHRPAFSLSSLRTNALNLTTASDGSTSSLTTLFNLTLISKNPNSRTFTFLYDPFVISLSSASGSVFLGNGSIPPFASYPKNQTTLRTVASAALDNVDAGSVASLRSDLKRKNGLTLEIRMDTMVRVEAGGRRSKKVGIRVVCGGIKGVSAPRDKNATVVADVAYSNCKVDLRIKIWRFTF
ncbi:hypothetical protein BT93_H0535 [Corymbia citriodora subsp. variegata]|nr:hypothetical protein BT93_H0535 [Corymbia citriodora subsp. variegata]